MNAKPLSRWSCMRMAAVAIAATVLGCGGGGALPGQTASCTATLSGALSGTYDCKPAATAWQSSNNMGAFAFQVQQAGSTPGIQVGIGWTGEPQVKHYKQSDADAQGGVIVQTASSQNWSAVAGFQGTYDLNFTSVTNPISASNGKVYTTAGTLDATLPATSGTGATGTITVHVTF